MNTNLLCVVLQAVVLVLGAVCLWQRRENRRKNRALVRFITEGYKYKTCAFFDRLRQTDKFYGDLRVMSGKSVTFAVSKQKTIRIMTAIIERTPTTVTVRMSTRRWERLQQMEKAYKLARTIERSMKQVETEPSMTPEEAIEALRAL